MDYPLSVSCRQTPRDFAGDAEGLGPWEGSRECVTQRLADHELHREEGRVAMSTEVVGSGNVRVGDPSSKLHFAAETKEGVGGHRYGGEQQLERHLLIERPVVRAPDDAHSAAAEEGQQLVAIVEDRAGTEPSALAQVFGRRIRADGRVELPMVHQGRL